MIAFFTLSNRRVKQLLVVCVDALLIAASLFISYGLSLGTSGSAERTAPILNALPLVLAVKLIIFALLGLYRGLWRFVGVRDLIAVIQAVTLSSVLSAGLIFFIYRLDHYPRSIFVIDWFVTMVVIGGSRLAYRLYREGWARPPRAASASRGTRVLIVGAGRAGELLLRELSGNHRMSHCAVGFVDDDRKKRHMTIHGCQVLGNTRDIPRIAERYGIGEVFLAIPSASGSAKRRILFACKRAGVIAKTLPDLSQILNGQVTVQDLREFRIEDLLGREQARLDPEVIEEYLRGKTVMITGAGGSIGSDLCRQVLRFSPRRLILFENREFDLYTIHMSLQELYPQAEVHPVIGDVLNLSRVERTMLRFKPDVVFHAAAYKHVPLMELNAEEALRNNAIGTWNMARLAHDQGVKKFVLVSTDKAVRPANIMGASKRIAELICQSFNRQGETQFMVVRFGNVLNSVGSVIPLFRKQILQGGPVTVTHPNIFRYFMTIPEAAQLILQAGAMGEGGEVFLLNMGKPVRIADLARDMITLSGYAPDRDIKIVFTGLRPGEKLNEELLTGSEAVKATLHEKIMVAKADFIDRHAVLEKITLLFHALNDGISDEIRELVRELVPEFQPENGGPHLPVTALKNRSVEVPRE